MGNFGRGGSFGGGGRKFGGGFRDRGFGDRPAPRLHQATCDKCHRPCEVPFRPTGEKPVYCQDCFRTEGPAASGKFGGRDAGRPSFEEKRMFEATCDRCGSRCEVPFRPTGEKPVYCRACFGKNDGGRVEQKPDQAKMQFDILNAKLDKIIKALDASQPRKEAIAADKPAKAVAAEAKKDAAPTIPAEAKPVEAGAEAKPKKAVGKKTSAKKAAKTVK